jgi:hypothetical protein
MRWITLAILILVAAPRLAGAAEPVSDAEFFKAPIQLDAGRQPRMHDIETLIACLAEWNPGDGRGRNKIEVKRTGDDKFTISVSLRSPTDLYFEMAREQGAPVALLRRVEYFLIERKTYQQFTDTETKRAALHGACPSL